MLSRRILTAIVLVLSSITVAAAWPWTLIVSDPATTARNAVTAVLKSRMVETSTEQGRRLHRMAQRLSVSTSLDKYAVADVPRWRVYRFQNINVYANPYADALNYGDHDGRAYAEVARTRLVPGKELAALAARAPAAAAVIAAQLATLDLADSTIIAGTDQNGELRPQGKREMRAINALEGDVIDSSQTQSATAVLDKISAATLIEARQKQSRLQFTSALVEQLIVDNKRARDTETALMNMQLRRLAADVGEGGGFLSGAGNDLRRWRQP